MIEHSFVCVKSCEKKCVKWRWRVAVIVDAIRFVIAFLMVSKTIVITADADVSYRFIDNSMTFCVTIAIVPGFHTMNTLTAHSSLTASWLTTHSLLTNHVTTDNARRMWQVMTTSPKAMNVITDWHTMVSGQRIPFKHGNHGAIWSTRLQLPM